MPVETATATISATIASARIKEEPVGEWFSGDVVANGIRTHYSRTGGQTGGGKPPLVLAHGATDSGLCWSRLARALEADYDVIMPDARGHGHPRRRLRPDAAPLISPSSLGAGTHRPAVGGIRCAKQCSICSPICPLAIGHPRIRPPAVHAQRTEADRAAHGRAG
jgi:pimeloyl-ACP methyl ester carboxylesterase